MYLLFPEPSTYSLIKTVEIPTSFTVILTVSISETPLLSVTVNLKLSSPVADGAVKVTTGSLFELKETVCPFNCSHSQVVISPSISLLPEPFSVTRELMLTFWSIPASDTGGIFDSPSMNWI